MLKIINIFFMMAIILGLTACGSAETLIKKRNLAVQTKMSSTVFLEPVARDKRLIFVNIRNTSDKQLTIQDRIRALLSSKGYRIVDDPAQASFMLQANVLKVGKSNLQETSSALNGGFGGALVGLALAGDSQSSRRNAGLAGAVVGFVADALVDDVLYTMITDIQVRERPLNDEIVTQQQKTAITQGISTHTTQQSKAQIKWKTYRTRIVSTANQVNLNFETAKLKLEEGLVRSISGVF